MRSGKAKNCISCRMRMALLSVEAKPHPDEEVEVEKEEEEWEWYAMVEGAELRVTSLL